MGNLVDILKKTGIGLCILALTYAPLDAQKSESYYSKKTKDNSHCFSNKTYNLKKYKSSPFLVNSETNYCYKTTSRKEKAFRNKLNEGVKCSFKKSSYYRKKLGK